MTRKRALVTGKDLRKERLDAVGKRTPRRSRGSPAGVTGHAMKSMGSARSPGPRAEAASGGEAEGKGVGRSCSS